MPDNYYPLKQAQGVAQFMSCSVQEAIKLAKDDGALFNEVVMMVRAENIAREWRERTQRH